MVVDGCRGADVVVLVEGGEEPSVLPDDGRTVDDEGRTTADPQAAISTIANAEHDSGRRPLPGGGSHGSIHFSFVAGHWADAILHHELGRGSRGEGN